jgi:hypothetical protein
LITPALSTENIRRRNTDPEDSPNDKKIDRYSNAKFPDKVVLEEVPMDISTVLANCFLLPARSSMATTEATAHTICY